MFFRIDNHTNEHTYVTQDWDKLHLAFAIPYNLHKAHGVGRTAQDIAFHIADSLSTEPLFIGPDKEEIHECLKRAQQALVVGINLPYENGEKNNRLLTIGANDFTNYSFARSCDVVLSPFFNPVYFHRKNAVTSAKGQLVIPYNATATRIRPDIATHSLFPPKSDQYKNPKVPRTIAVYYRSPGDSALSDLLNKFDELNKAYGCSFLLSTGPGTPDYHTMKLKKGLAAIPGSEFFDFKNPQKRANPLESYFTRADAIVVTDDTISTLSDAVGTAKPVFVHTVKDPDCLFRGDYYSDQNHRLQRQLLQQNRIRLFTTENLKSGWQPGFLNEWKFIGDRIAKVVQQRQEAILTSSEKRPKGMRPRAHLESSLS